MSNLNLKELWIPIEVLTDKNLSDESSWKNIENHGKNMHTIERGGILFDKLNDEDYIGRDKYVTVVYYRYNKGTVDEEELKEFMQKNKCDVLETKRLYEKNFYIIFLSEY